MAKKTIIWSSDKCDLKFSHHIRDRDEKKCFFCGQAGSQNSHFWGRGNSGTRYDPENCDYACGGCHMRNEGNKQGLYRELKLRQLGPARYAALEARARGVYPRLKARQDCMELLGATIIT